MAALWFKIGGNGEIEGIVRLGANYRGKLL